MSVDKATVRRIAHLARIGVKEEELEGLAGELSHILRWVEQLDTVDTANVPPMASARDQALRWRADVVTDGGKAEAIIGNAPNRQDGFFTVPKVVE